MSFGTTQLLNGWYGKSETYLPTSSATLILSRTIFEDFALWSVFNLPLVPNQKVTDEGLLVQTQTPPALMLGVSYELIGIPFEQERLIGLDVGASVGREFTIDGRVFPVGAVRLKVVKSADNTIYIGATTSPYNPKGDLVWGLIYGLGTRF